MKIIRTYNNFLTSLLRLIVLSVLIFSLTSNFVYAQGAGNPFFGTGAGNPDMTPINTGIQTGLNPISSIPDQIPTGPNSLGHITNTTNLKDCPSAPTGDFVSILKYALCFINSAIIPVLMILALVVFIFGLVRYILTTGDKKKREEAQKYILWSVIAFFVILSVWGLVHIISSTFNLNLSGPSFFTTDPNHYTCPNSFPSDPKLADLVNFVTCRISDLLVPLLVSVAVLLFIYGIFLYLTQATSDKARKDGASFMLWGIIALFVILSVWGLVGILRSTFHVSAIPQFDGKW